MHHVLMRVTFYLQNLSGVSVEHFFRRLVGQLHQAVQELDFNGWVVVMAILLTSGWFFLRGNKIKSA